MGYTTFSDTPICLELSYFSKIALIVFDCLENIVGKPPSLKHEIFASSFHTGAKSQFAYHTNRGTCWRVSRGRANSSGLLNNCRRFHPCLPCFRLISRMNCAPNPISKSPGSSPNYQNSSKSRPIWDPYHWSTSSKNTIHQQELAHVSPIFQPGHMMKSMKKTP